MCLSPIRRHGVHRTAKFLLSAAYLPKGVIESGLLSDAQLESVIYAGEAHGGHLAGSFLVNESFDTVAVAPDDAGKAVGFRRGYYLGDGTGAGKGRRIAGIVLDNWLKGRRKALWISKSDKLIEDARRDWAALGHETLHGSLDNLTVSRIDPHAETERYRQEVLRTKGAKLDAQGRALLEEDLRSPCTEEIAVFQAFSRIIREAGEKFVVMDTAPTGHTLLLLDATGAYHREVARMLDAKGAHYLTPMMQLQDPNRTKILLVTLAETTPVLQAANLQADLRRGARRRAPTASPPAAVRACRVEEKPGARLRERSAPLRHPSQRCR